MKVGCLVIGLVALLISSGANAFVRQRFYYQGRESIIAWPKGGAIKLSMYDFSGETLGQSTSSTKTTIDFATTQNLIGDSIAQWNQKLFGGLSPGFTLDLLAGKPYPTDNNCETKPSTEGSGDSDGVNNILFTSKLGVNCGTPLTAYRSAGVIGLTGVRFKPSSGEIGEADMQFDDVDYLFLATGTNDLDATPRKIVLKDAVTHEVGHFLGLDHSPVRESTMLFAIAENLHTTKHDDQLGLLSLYPPNETENSLGQAEGSLTDITGKPVFGGVVFFLNPRTLEVNASEMSDVNGAFHFCALPAGPQIAFATPYRPFGTNIHAYYSGNGDGLTTSDEYGCFNPGCLLMTKTLAHSWWGMAPSVGNGGLALNIANVPAGGLAKYINITARTAGNDGVELIPPEGSRLALDEPRVVRLTGDMLPLAGSANEGINIFYFNAPPSGEVQVHTAALGIYSRVKLQLQLLDEQMRDVTTLKCPISEGHGQLLNTADDVANARDPWLDCSALTPGAKYALRVQGGAIACDLVPGNKSECITSGGEAASTSIPYYIINVFETSKLNDLSLKGPALAASSFAAKRFSNMPQCEARSLDVQDATRKMQRSQNKQGGCCGTLGGPGPGGPSGPASFALALLLSPLAWFALYRATRATWGRLRLVRK